MPDFTLACAPARVSMSTSLPATAETTIGPLTNSAPFLLITVMSLMPAIAEAMPPQGPSTSATCGTTPEIAFALPAISA